MKIKPKKWTGFAWTPMYCNICGQRFWLEHYKIFHTDWIIDSIFGPDVYCHSCAKKKEKEDAE